MGMIVRTGNLRQREARQAVREGTRLSRGVYFLPASPTDAPSLADRARAALMVCPDGSAVCDITVLQLAGVDMPEGMRPPADGPIHVLIPPDVAARSRRPDLVIHQHSHMPSTFYSERLQITAVNPEHCWAQVTARLFRGRHRPPIPQADPADRGSFVDGSKLALLQAVQLGDALTRRHRPLVSPDRFAAQMGLLTGMAGVQAVRETFGLIRPGTDSPNETWLRLVVIDAGFPEPTVNHKLELGRRTRFLDLSWPDRLIALEYQGGQHFDDPRQSRDDLQRRGQLQTAGWVMVEAVYHDLHHPGELIGRLTAAFAGRPPV
ncbi:MAG: hypothetical protein LBK95_14625 [Bifidobacteriaceae bacterium]|jgi:hypothetical protein|nr:hypothetical protein [Bifidobacteriaceae bacterium]